MELYERVRSFAPERIVEYLQEKEGISREEALARWDEMLKFLVLCVTSEKVFAPSEAVDTAWHAFLMHTQEYEAFCLDQLGVFVHHNPKPNPVAEFENSLEEVFTSFPGYPVRRHLWIPKGDARLAAMGDCEDGGSDCIGRCAEVGCHRTRSPRAQALPSVVAFGRA